MSDIQKLNEYRSIVQKIKERSECVYLNKNKYSDDAYVLAESVLKLIGYLGDK